MKSDVLAFGILVNSRTAAWDGNCGGWGGLQIVTERIWKLMAEWKREEEGKAMACREKRVIVESKKSSAVSGTGAIRRTL